MSAWLAIPLPLALALQGAVTATTSTGGYTLEQCLSAALAHNPDLEVVEADVRIAEADLDRAKSGRWPRVDYTQLLGAVNEAHGDAISSPNSTTDYLKGLGPFTRLDLRVTQPVYAFGKISAGIRAAESGLLTSHAKKKEKQAALVFDVKQRYYDLLLNQKLGGEIADVEKALTKALAKAKDRLNEGNASVTQSDLLEIEYALEGIRTERLRVEMGAQLSSAALRRAMGLASTEPFALAATEVLDEAQIELRALAYYQEHAVERRPELARLASAIEARAARVDQRRADLFPTIFLMGLLRYAVAPNRTDQKNPFVYDDFNYLDPGVVLGLRWDFDLGMLAELDKAEAKHAKLLSQRRAAAAGIRLEVEHAFREVLSSRARLESARRRRTIARNLTVLAATNYELGLGDAKPLLDSLERRTRSTGELYLALRNHDIAIARLIKAADLGD